MGRELDPRCTETFGSHTATCSENVGHHEIDVLPSEVGQQFGGDERGARVDTLPGIQIVVLRPRCQSSQRKCPQPESASVGHPTTSGEQDRFVTGTTEQQRQGYGRKGMSRIGPGHHCDSHRPSVPHPTRRARRVSRSPQVKERPSRAPGTQIGIDRVRHLAHHFGTGDALGHHLGRLDSRLHHQQQHGCKRRGIPRTNGRVALSHNDQ